LVGGWVYQNRSRIGKIKIDGGFHLVWGWRWCWWVLLIKKKQKKKHAHTVKIIFPFIEIRRGWFYFSLPDRRPVDWKLSMPMRKQIKMNLWNGYRKWIVIFSIPIAFPFLEGAKISLQLGDDHHSWIKLTWMGDPSDFFLFFLIKPDECIQRVW
jgi:hypothetical protein